MLTYLFALTYLLPILKETMLLYPILDFRLWSFKIDNI